MQQPPGPQEQLAVQQQMGHQMVLCPVRLVYETQILVQPGDQIQPNQTIVINPQNPPPWIQQNRPVQNQVMYIQQFQPNNMVPSAPQHIDQNQYIVQQNLANIQQQVMQQQMIMQNQQEQMRQVQMQYTNVIPTEMIQNLRPALPQNVQNTQNANEQSMVKFGQPQTPTDNAAQNQVNMQNAINRQLVANIQNANQNMVNVQRSQAPVMQAQTNLVQGMYPNMHNIQMSQQIVNSPRQQIQQYITMNPMGAMQNTQNINQVNNVRPNQQNVQIRQVHSQAVIQNMPNAQPVYSNANQTQNVMMTRAIKPSTPMTMTRPSVSVNNTGTMTIRQNFRPIQPRPQTQFKPNMNATPPNNMQVQRIPQVMPQVQNQMQHIPISVSYTIPKQENTSTINITPHSNTVKVTEATPIFNRKRKSESPDEIHKKIINTTTQVSEMTVTKLQNNLMAKNIARSEIGINTSPVHKVVDNSIINQQQPLHYLPMNSPYTAVSQQNNVLPPNQTNPATIIKMETTNTQQIVPKPVEIGKSMPDIMPISPQINNKDNKPLRNTVFTQARGRVVSEKVEAPQPITPNRVENLTLVLPEVKQVINTQPEGKPIEIKPPIPEVKFKPEKYQQQETPNTIEVKARQPDIKMEIQHDTDQSKPIKMEINEAQNVTNEIVETAPIKSEVKEIKDVPCSQPIERKECKSTSVDNLREKQIQMTDTTKSKEEREFILTHVLDGYVIQESNVAFPIRKPLQERLIPNETVDKTEEKKERSKEEKETKAPGDKVVDNMLSLNLTETQNSDGQVEDMAIAGVEDPALLSPSLLGPFEKLDTKTVKSWTVNQLSTHLMKYGWTETINILREHEIDGESLFLVSKQQLVTIGINESHAESICGFVKS